MDPLEELKKNIDFIEERLNFCFSDKQLLILTFVHRSFSNENRAFSKEHNERLEFLGDAVLGFFISDFLYTLRPQSSEGELSSLRSRLVDASACFFYMKKLKIDQFLLMGKGEVQNEGKGRNSVLSDLFEALIGAIYLDGGIEKTRQFFFCHYKSDVQSIIEKPYRNWKAELQDYYQKKIGKQPIYRVVKQEGPDHQCKFYMIVESEKEKIGEGAGFSKKEAEQNAAQDAILRREKLQSLEE
jgi:ribonuclease III